MSLAIRVDRVTAVLLADGWHAVHDESFLLDAYEFLDDDGEVLHAGGQDGLCATGFEFFEVERGLIAGPLTSVLAVSYGSAGDVGAVI